MKMRRLIFMALILGTLLSFHDTLWPYTLIPLVIAAGFYVIAVRIGEAQKWGTDEDV